ncbi:MAG: DUF4442 domain-containing protein [Saprospiraceae bacterium]|uniref:DUF4442 domain-containing protein n=1 Tax=Candidatus Opimibacter skivensis TaxID=2982028 RepID=A0A9D7XU17_9BACT|nr:DUF4442 domain-containing protein [Candidatus Opimibacter skivensis]
MSFNKKLSKQLTTPWKMRMWMLRRLPMGLISGMVIDSLDENGCRVMLKDRLWIRNPFGSVFWAVMGMAAELSTGALVYAYVSGTNTKYILTGVKGEFLKKVRGKSYYFCNSGQEVQLQLDSLRTPGETLTISLPVTAHDQAGQKVASFEFYWQLKRTDN